mgnify:CR=1 FL=1
MGVLKKWREMSWFRRVLVALLAGMILGGGIATTVVTGREGIKYQDTLLLLTREGEACRYTGRLDGERAEFTVRPGGLVEYRWGEEAYGPYQYVGCPEPGEGGAVGLVSLFGASHVDCLHRPGRLPLLDKPDRDQLEPVFTNANGRLSGHFAVPPRWEILKSTQDSGDYPPNGPGKLPRPSGIFAYEYRFSAHSQNR